MRAFSAEEVGAFVAGLTRSCGSDAHRLLQYLIEAQGRYSYVPPAAIEQLIRDLDVTHAQITAAVEFYAFLHASPRGDYEILLSDNITDRMLGNAALLERLCARLGVVPEEPRADRRVTVGLTSCTGMCDQGPAALVNGRALTRLDPERLDLIAELVEAAVPLEQWPAELFEVADQIRRADILLSRRDTADEGLGTLLAGGAERVLGEITRSGLRGRGGAGFETAAKWTLCRETEADTRYVICNADEGEPGAFKDRVLLNSYAEQVFEGITLCGVIVGARQGYLYLRGEYAYLRPHLEAVLAGRRVRGLLGAGILGQGRWDFEIEIRMGAGAYVCGEESALIESLEGKRGVTRKRPPFPVSSGFLGKPTVVNNVETFLAAAHIAAKGGDWFRAVGTPESAGSKILSVSGDCAAPGIYEYPYGVSVRQVLADCGAEAVQAVQVSGAAGTLLGPARLGRRLAFEDLPTSGSFMVFDQRRDLLELVHNFSHFFAHESCGFCTPCRVGTRLLCDLVDKVQAHRAGRYDLEELRRLGAILRAASHCGLGKTAPNAVLDTLDQFPDLYNRRLRSEGFEPAFDLEGALVEARTLADTEVRAPAREVTADER